MNINQASIEKLLRINWLSNAGKDSSIPDTIRVKNINAFQINLESEEWENVTLEARNNITGWLAKKHVNAFLEWNKLADAAAIIIESKIVPQIPPIGGICGTILLSMIIAAASASLFHSRKALTCFFANQPVILFRASKVTFSHSSLSRLI